MGRACGFQGKELVRQGQQAYHRLICIPWAEPRCGAGVGG